MLVLAFVSLSFSPIPLPSSRFFLLYSFYICLYPGLLSFHQWIQTNCNHSLQHKSNFTVSNNMLLELLGREINIPLFVQDHNGKDFFWRNSFSVKDMQCTNRRTSKVTCIPNKVKKSSQQFLYITIMDQKCTNDIRF